MEADSRTRQTTHLRTLAALAGLLQRLEQQPRTASAEQYRGVAQQVTQLLKQVDSGPELDALLALAPATAELYENLQYRHAGLCRSPLEAALNAELATAAALAKAR